MHTIVPPFVMRHGRRTLQRERANARKWFGGLKLRVARTVADRSKRRKIALILAEERAAIDRSERRETACDRAMTLPPAWSHKTEIHAGDTIYLRHKDTIRGLLLTAAGDADPINGKVSVISPIGMALVGRHPSDCVRISTLDGDVEYQILKIV